MVEKNTILQVMKMTALSMPKGSSSFAREKQPSNRKRHLLRPEKVMLSSITRCTYGLGSGDQRLPVVQRASYKRKNIFVWGNCHHGDLRS